MIDHVDHIVLTTATRTPASASTRGCSHEAGEVQDADRERLAAQFGQQKINLHEWAGSSQPRAHVAVPGSLDLCFISAVPLEDVVKKLKTEKIAISKVGGEDRRMGPMRSVYVRDPASLGGNLGLTIARRRRGGKCWRLILGGVLAVLAGAAAAQEYPAKPIRFIVPFTPGGGTDIVARTVAAKLTETKKWAIAVENKPGAGGNLGIDQAAKSAPDGYNHGDRADSNLAINPTLYRKLPYDPVKDLAPVCADGVGAHHPRHLGQAALQVAGRGRRRGQGEARAAELRLARQRHGGAPHGGALPARPPASSSRIIPYKGASQAMTDLMGGQVDLYLSSVPSAIAQLKGGKLRALAVTGAKAQRRAAGGAGRRRVGLQGIRRDDLVWPAVPRRNAGAGRELVNGEVNRVLKLAEVRSRLAAEGGDVLGGTPAEFAAVLKTDLTKWARS